MLKELLQEYLKRQDHFHGRVVLHDSFRVAEVFGIPTRDNTFTSTVSIISTVKKTNKKKKQIMQHIV